MSSYIPLNSISAYVSALKKRDFSCEEAVLSQLKLIQEKDERIHSFLCLSDTVIKEAQEIDSKIKQGEVKNMPLLGVPLGVKDIFVTQGLKTTAGSKLLEGYLPQYDATVVQRLKKAGCIVMGKLNLDAWAHGSSGENSDYEPALNPYDLKRTPGGSSSGSASAVSSGECMVATGTDTGGSVRLPASFCGVVGLKPTYGRVSRYGVIAMASSFDSVGHITRNVTDSALVLETTAGKDKFDATTSSSSVPHYHKELNINLKGKRVGLIREFFESPGLDSEIKKLIMTQVDLLEKQGAEVVNLRLPHIEYAMACYYILVPSEVSSNLARFDGVRYGNSRSFFSDEAKRRIMMGTYTLSSGYYDAYYRKAQKVRTCIIEDFKKAFSQCDVLVAPTSPTTAFKLGEKQNDPLQMYLSDIYVCPMNIAGVPALSIPVGLLNGLPVGMQFIGPHMSEPLLFACAHFVEEVQKKK